MNEEMSGRTSNPRACTPCSFLILALVDISSSNKTLFLNLFYARWVTVAQVPPAFNDYPFWSHTQTHTHTCTHMYTHTDTDHHHSHPQELSFTVLCLWSKFCFLVLKMSVFLFLLSLLFACFVDVCCCFCLFFYIMKPLKQVLISPSMPKF